MKWYRKGRKILGLGDLLVMERSRRALLLINGSMTGSTSELLDSFLTVEEGGGLLECAVLGLNDVCKGKMSINEMGKKGKHVHK
jgi:hypothetical protein